MSVHRGHSARASALGTAWLETRCQLEAPQRYPHTLLPTPLSCEWLHNRLYHSLFTVSSAHCRWHRAIAFVILSDRRKRRISVAHTTSMRFFVAIAPQNDRFHAHPLQMRSPRQMARPSEHQQGDRPAALCPCGTCTQTARPCSPVSVVRALYEPVIGRKQGRRPPASTDPGVARGGLCRQLSRTWD